MTIRLNFELMLDIIDFESLFHANETPRQLKKGSTSCLLSWLILSDRGCIPPQTLKKRPDQ
jgi:hypothetical protein